jgi:hypothetical protein
MLVHQMLAALRDGKSYSCAASTCVASSTLDLISTVGLGS